MGMIFGVLGIGCTSYDIFNSTTNLSLRQELYFLLFIGNDKISGGCKTSAGLTGYAAYFITFHDYLIIPLKLSARGPPSTTETA
jgi:hypothetical protein